jgi:hypothetical protein
VGRLGRGPQAVTPGVRSGSSSESMVMTVAVDDLDLVNADGQFA